MGSVAGIVQPIAEEKGLVVTLIPPPSDARIGQPAVLNRVLLNLTTNALKFTVKGGVEVAATQRSRTRLEFSVHDTGRGIPPSVMDTLFDAFRRRPKPGEYTFSSAGLGLAICQKLVASLGGDLAVDTSDAGTRFHFELDLPIASRM
jgi:signal transduction histidine kinase